EARALRGRALDLDRATVLFDDLPRDPQAEPETADVPVDGGALEALEDARLIAGGDADAVVADDEDGASAAAKHAHLDALAAGVLDGVGDEVGHHLVDALAVPLALDRLAPVVDAAARRRDFFGEALDDLGHEDGEIEALARELHLARADAGHVEEVADEALDAAALRRHLVGALAEDLGVAAVEEEADAGDLERQRRQRRAKLVPGDRGEVIAGSHPPARPAVKARVVDGDAGAAGELLGDAAVLVVEWAGAHHGERSELRAACGERDRQLDAARLGGRPGAGATMGFAFEEIEAHRAAEDR